MNRQTVAVTFAIVVSTVAGVALFPKSASACLPPRDVGTCVPPSVLYPTFEIGPELECVEIDKTLVEYGDYQWEFEIHNGCASTLYASKPLFECSSQLEAGETAALSVPGNSLTTGTCTEPDDGTNDAGTGTADVGTNDAGTGTADVSTIADTWSPDGESGPTPVDAGPEDIGPDGGGESTFRYVYELYLDDVGYQLEYEYVEPDSSQVVEDWKAENCPRARCAYVDVYSPESEEESQPDGGSPNGSDAGTAWRSGGSDSDSSGACSTSGSSTPAGSALLVAFLALVGFIRRRPFERTA